MVNSCAVGVVCFGWIQRHGHSNVPTGASQEVLLQQVTQQGDNLHFVALAAAQTDTRDVPDMAKTLMQDLEVSFAEFKYETRS